MAQQDALQQLQGPWQGLKRCPVAQSSRLALDQAHIVAPVVEGLTALEAAHMAGNALVLSYDLQSVRVQAQADDLVGVLGRHAVTVAL